MVSKPEKHRRTPARAPKDAEPTRAVTARVIADPGRIPARSPALEGSPTRLSSGEVEDYLVTTLGITKSTAESTWAGILKLFALALVGDRDVSLVHVATLHPYLKQESRYRDPVTKEIVPIAGCRHVKLTLSTNLKDDLRNEGKQAKAQAHWARVQKAQAAARATAQAEAKKQEKVNKKVRKVARHDRDSSRAAAFLLPD